MSLDFNYAQCDEKVLWDENDRMRPEVESIIWNTMFLGINKITEDNYRAFFVRYNMIGMARSNNFVPYFNLSDVKGMIGLHTNASTKSETVFKKECTEALQKRAEEFLNGELNALGLL